MPNKGDSWFESSGTLFNRPIARNTDPEPSREAAEFIVESGGVARMRGQLVALVGNNPGKTASELQKLYERQGGNGHLWKRVDGAVGAGLIRRGKVRKCTVTQRMAATLYAVEK